MKNILITGATGYIGRRLKERLLKRADLSIRLLVRNRNKVCSAVLPKVEIVEGDTSNRDALLQTLKGIDVAYYRGIFLCLDKDSLLMMGGEREDYGP